MKPFLALQQRRHDLRTEAGELASKIEAMTATEAEQERAGEIAAELDQVDAQIATAEKLRAAQRLLPAVETVERIPAQVREEPEKFKSLGEQLLAVASAQTPGGFVDRRLAPFAATGLNEGTPSQGGYLVQQDTIAGLVDRMYEDGAVLSRVRRIPVSAGSNGVKINGIDETSRANGSRWGGVQAYWAAEAGTVTASKPKFRQITLDLKKCMALVYATDELLADASAMQAVVSQVVPAELRFKVEDGIIRGTGAGQPLGILTNSDVYVSVAKETGQAADTFLYENAVKMWSRMWAPSRRNAVWFINQDVEPQLFSMALSVGTGGVPVYMPAGGISGAPYGSLFGRPVIPIEQADTVGDLGDVILADMSQYAVIEKGGIDAASSMHVQFLYAEQVFRFIYRIDGQPLWQSSLTPYQSSNTLSPFVVLAARA